MKAILVFTEMPKSCDECEVRCGGYTAKEYSEKGIKRPSWCPLKPLPEKRDVPSDYGMMYGNPFGEGWNACLKEIENESTEKVYNDDLYEDWMFFDKES